MLTGSVRVGAHVSLTAAGLRWARAPLLALRLPQAHGQQGSMCRRMAGEMFTAVTGGRSEPVLEMAVKPSAQPTLVRTQYLPPPAETARGLGFLGVAGWCFWPDEVPLCP